jgi:hypothetical protein
MMLDVTATARAHAVVLVEGLSDQAALEALALRRGQRVGSEGIAIVPMGGATNIGHFLGKLGPGGLDVRLAGLCDAAEADFFLHALERAGIGSGISRADLERHGFYVCDPDLEDELIRAVGAGQVERIIEGQGEIGSFRTFQKQPAQQGRSLERQLHRFMGTRSGRKSQYARLMSGAVDLARVPRPLDRVLSHW